MIITGAKIGKFLAMLRFFGQYFIRQAASILLGLYVLYRSEDVGHLSDGYRTVVRQLSDDCPTPSGKPGRPLSWPFEDTDAGSGSTIKNAGPKATSVLEPTLCGLFRSQSG